MKIEISVKVIMPFRNGVGATDAAVVEIDGIRLLAKRVKGATRLEAWKQAYDVPPDENPGWDKLDELCEQGFVEYVYVGRSIAHDDHYRWLGEPIPGLDGDL